jgi:hypothetical protein
MRKKFLFSINIEEIISPEDNREIITEPNKDRVDIITHIEVIEVVIEGVIEVIEAEV